MKTIFFALFVATLLSACATEQKPRGFEMPLAMREVFRGGQLKGLEYAEEPDLGMPNQFDRTQHVCVSSPMYDLYGQYLKTDVRCY